MYLLIQLCKRLLLLFPISKKWSSKFNNVDLSINLPFSFRKRVGVLKNGFKSLTELVDTLCKKSSVSLPVNFIIVLLKDTIMPTPCFRDLYSSSTPVKNFISEPEKFDPGNFLINCSIIDPVI